MKIGDKVICTISDRDEKTLKKGQEYEILSISEGNIHCPESMIEVKMPSGKSGMFYMYRFKVL